MRLAFLFIALAPLTLVSAQTWRRQVFVPGFSVEAPARLEQLNIKGGRAREKTWLFRGETFGLTAGIFQGKPGDSKVPAHMLRDFKAGLLDSMRGKLVREKPLALGGYQGLEFEVSATGGVRMAGRVYAGGGRLFSLGIVWRDPTRPDASIKRYFGTVKLPPIK